MEWGSFTREYFTTRGTLASVLLLVDASIPPMALDLSCAAWLGDSEVSLLLTQAYYCWCEPRSAHPTLKIGTAVR